MPIFDDARSTWNAAANTNPRPVDPSARTGISWHYPGGSLSITPATAHTACLSQVKAWQTYHMTDPGHLWADIGYNLLVCQHARVIEGRGVDLQGAHSPGVNFTNYGVMFMVSNNNAPTAEMYNRAAQLRYDLEQHSGHDLTSIGHMDDPQASTACPGPVIEAWVKAGGPDALTPAEDPLMAYTLPQIADAVWTSSVAVSLKNAVTKLGTDLAAVKTVADAAATKADLDAVRADIAALKASVTVPPASYEITLGLAPKSTP